MKIRQEDLIKEIQKVFPGLRVTSFGVQDIYCGDPKYFLPMLHELKQFLADDATSQKKYIEGKGDCNFFTSIVYAHCRERTWDKEELPWAFGEAWGTKFEGKHVSGQGLVLENGMLRSVDTIAQHAVNICLTSDFGLQLIQAQTDKTWAAKKLDDILVFAKF